LISRNIHVDKYVYLLYIISREETVSLKFHHKFLHSTVVTLINFQNVGYGRGATGLVLYVLSFLTTVGNAMVIHAIRTERRLQTVSRQDRRL
jgi:hypothetical protein